ncbi:uncharacterized protein LOC128884937 [Hylaeus volcanicus]|uniref:uncharacterized protein LOC128884937 n=1 Tax=Hylaeus volcanicus TaxID=313075 RepID=UPI0023B7D72B|nr:uncharacterized protein LOC128884937 [Hylaeus volcanicus]
MAKVLQGNLNRSRVADALLEQLRREREADVLLLSEPYRARKGPTWFADTLGTAAICIPDPSRFRVQARGAGAGFVWVRGEGLTLASVYLSPNNRIVDFRDKIEALEDTIGEQEGGWIVGGDFNAKAVEWGMLRPDTRGRYVVEMAARRNLVILNRGSSTTFRRFGYQETIIDITMASEGVAPRIEDWKVLEDYTGSDHQYVSFRISGERRRSRVSPAHRGWNLKTLQTVRFEQALQAGLQNISRPARRTYTRISATMHAVRDACDASMSHGRPRRATRPAHWWSEAARKNDQAPPPDGRSGGGRSIESGNSALDAEGRPSTPSGK